MPEPSNERNSKTESHSLRIHSIEVPPAVMNGSQVVLACNYELQGDQVSAPLQPPPVKYSTLPCAGTNCLRRSSLIPRPQNSCTLSSGTRTTWSFIASSRPTARSPAVKRRHRWSSKRSSSSSKSNPSRSLSLRESI